MSLKKSVHSPSTASSHNTETPFVDFSLLGGAESLKPEPKQDPWLPRRTEIPHPQDIQNVYGSMPQDPSDFLWLMTEEPHRSRRRAIMKAHPEVSIDSPSASFLFSAVPCYAPFQITQATLVIFGSLDCSVTPCPSRDLL